MALVNIVYSNIIMYFIAVRGTLCDISISRTNGGQRYCAF